MLEFPGGKQATFQSLSCNKHQRSNVFAAFYGEDGAMEIDWNGGYRIWGTHDKLREEWTPSGSDAEHVAHIVSAEEHIDNFLTAIRSGKHRDLNAETEFGHTSTLLCHLGNIAYRTNNVLKCDPKTGHIIGDDRAMEFWKREYEPGWEPVV